MSIRAIKDRLAQHHRDAKLERELSRALSNAPTQASRQELLAMLGR